jgi:hypothetical protein
LSGERQAFLLKGSVAKNSSTPPWRGVHMIKRIFAFTVLFLLLSAEVRAQTEKDSPTTNADGSYVPMPLDLQKSDSYLRTAYRDVFRFLSSRNSCSDFYGGPDAATEVLNNLVARVVNSDFRRDVAFAMNGTFVSRQSRSPNVSYRLFEKTLVNRVGAFYRRKYEFEPDILPVGQFAAGTRPARALILLHELGHLIQGPNHEWLLEDDGADNYKSNRNTEKVQKACQRELKSLN